MPLIAWSRRPRSATITASQGTSEEEGCGKTGDGSRAPPQVTVSGLFDPRVAAWMADTGSTDKALEFETLCVSWIKSGARKRCVRAAARCLCLFSCFMLDNEY